MWVNIPLICRTHPLFSTSLYPYGSQDPEGLGTERDLQMQVCPGPQGPPPPPNPFGHFLLVLVGLVRRADRTPTAQHCPGHLVLPAVVQRGSGSEGQRDAQALRPPLGKGRYRDPHWDRLLIKERGGGGLGPWPGPANAPQI